MEIFLLEISGIFSPNLWGYTHGLSWFKVSLSHPKDKIILQNPSWLVLYILYRKFMTKIFRMQSISYYS